MSNIGPDLVAAAPVAGDVVGVVATVVGQVLPAVGKLLEPTPPPEQDLRPVDAGDVAMDAALEAAEKKIEGT